MGEKKQFSLVVPTRADKIGETIDKIVSFLSKYNCPTNLLETNIPLVLDELITNAMMHGNKWDPHKMVFISGEVYDDGIKIKVKDEGEGIPLSDVSSDKTPSLDYLSGRGIFLVKHHVSSMRISGNEVVVLINFADFVGEPANNKD